MLRACVLLLLALPLALSAATCSNSDEQSSTENLLLSVKTTSVKKSAIVSGTPDAPDASSALNLLERHTQEGWPFSWGWGWWDGKKDKDGKEDDDFKDDDEDNDEDARKEEDGDEDNVEEEEEDVEEEGREDAGSGNDGPSDGGSGDGGSSDSGSGDGDADAGNEDPGDAPAADAAAAAAGGGAAAAAAAADDTDAAAAAAATAGGGGDDRSAWVDAVNEKRALHGACPLEWTTPLADGIKEWVDGLTSLEHADSYHIPPPGGPCGENLAWASNGIAPAVAVEMWYNEVNNCAQPLPGCENPSQGTMTGHFTAMVWKGARTMGCAISANGNYAGCRWKAGDTLSADTPNMAMPGLYEQNVGAIGETPTGCS